MPAENIKIVVTDYEYASLHPEAEEMGKIGAELTIHQCLSVHLTASAAPIPGVNTPRLMKTNTEPAFPSKKEPITNPPQTAAEHAGDRGGNRRSHSSSGIICVSIIGGKTKAIPTRAGVPARPTNHVSAKLISPYIKARKTLGAAMRPKTGKIAPCTRESAGRFRDGSFHKTSSSILCAPSLTNARVTFDVCASQFLIFPRCPSLIQDPHDRPYP